LLYIMDWSVSCKNRSIWYNVVKTTRVMTVKPTILIYGMETRGEHLYCIIYRFTVRRGEETRFLAAWAEMTDAFIEFCHALGSRLHASLEQEYIAYAQWPSREAWEKAELPIDIQESAGSEMRACCESIETLFKLSPVDDRLIHNR